MLIHWLCSVPFAATICVFGLVGNLICALVWYQLYKKEKLNGAKSNCLYFICLSIADNGVLVTFLLSDTCKVLFPHIKENLAYITLFSYVIFPLFFYFMVVSRWLLIALTTFRYIMLIYPFKSNIICSTRRTKVALIGISLLAILPNVPFFFYFEASETPTGVQLSKSAFGAGQPGITNEFWVHCIALVLIPFVSIAMLNIFIVRQLSLSQKNILKKIDGPAIAMKGSRQKIIQNKITKMLLVVTTLFLILLFWQCVSKCFFMLTLGKTYETASTWNFVQVNFSLSKIGLVLNSAINGLIYSIFGGAFRKHMYQLLFYRCYRKRQLNNTLRITMASNDSITTKV